MMTDLAAVSAIATLANPEATWSLFDLAETMVGTMVAAVAAITTDREITTSPGSVRTKAVATRIPENFAGTRRKTTMRTESRRVRAIHLLIGISPILPIARKLAPMNPTSSVSPRLPENCAATLSS